MGWSEWLSGLGDSLDKAVTHVVEDVDENMNGKKGKSVEDLGKKEKKNDTFKFF